MALHFLTAANALNPGAELWLLPSPEDSHWSARLDWYMNFQLSRMLSHESPQLSEPLKKMIKTTGLSDLRQALPSAPPVLIATKMVLPNEWTLCLPYQRNLVSWLEAFLQQAEALNVYRTRVFFPKGIKLDDADEALRKYKNTLELTYLIES